MMTVVALQDAPPPPEVDPEIDWPRVFEKDGHEIVFFQPQIDKWEGYRTLEARAAVAVTPIGAEEAEASYGAVRLAADTEADFESHQVLLTEFRLTAVRFPHAEPADAARYEQMVRSIEPERESVILSLDRVLAGLEAGQHGVDSVEVCIDPPPIYYSGEPAILVIFMGKPQFELIEGAGLMYADNTDVDLFFDGETHAYYLLVGDSWLTTPDIYGGPWTVTLDPPAALANVPDEWKHVKWKIPGAPLSEVPRVFVVEGPSELIVTDGPPQIEAIEGAETLWLISNTDSDVFFHVPPDGDPAYYFLAAGRWFKASTLLGPWAAATGNLPEAFANIPRDHPQSHVLVSVPGTPDAEEAVLMASVPRMAVVPRDEIVINVEYDGAPLLEPIEGTSIHCVMNSPHDVFLVDGVYYCCNQGIWFISDQYDGPWEVADSVPDAIYEIPPSSPKHHVTYVRVYDSTEQTVEVGYTSGYTGEFIAFGAIMFGLGYALLNADNVTFYMHTGSRYYSYGHGARYDY
jgi:hypothetical protein